jgi:elongation factor G
MASGVLELEGRPAGGSQEALAERQGTSRERLKAASGSRAPMVRCVALVGPLGSGKTTLLEAILAHTGAIERAGSVAAGTTVGDASPEARAHGMSVEINIAETAFLDDRYTLVDCPGSIEFQAGNAGVLAAADVAIVVCEADARKVPALQVILKDLEERGIPRMLFLNKIDKVEGGVRDTLAVLQTASRTPLVLRQIPIWAGGIATGFIDLALERAYVYQEHTASETMAIPDAERAREVEARFQMLERVADYDDALMEELLSDIEPPRDRVFDDLAREMREGLICPVFLGSAERGHGIVRLLKALRHEAPAVAETRDRLGLAAGGETVVQVMKTLNSVHGGKLAVARVLAGTVSDGTVLLRSDGASGRVSGLFRISGGDIVKRGPATTGETAALAKLDIARTGATLSSAKETALDLVELSPQPPVMSLSIAPVDRKDEVKLAAALARIIEEDPGLSLTTDPDAGETRLCGQGEMHLRVALERLANRNGIAVTRRPPKVPYRETVRSAVTVRGRHKKQSGGHGQFADVTLVIEPLSRGSGFHFDDRITGGVVPRQYIPAVEAGAREALASGPYGFPVIDVAVALTDGATHPVDSSEQAFRAAAILAMRDGLDKAGSVLLEPILAVTIACPTEATPKANAIVSARRGQITGFEPRHGWPGWDVVNALVPQAEMSDLIIELRSATAGVGTFTAELDHLAELGGRIATDVVERHRRDAA